MTRIDDSDDRTAPHTAPDELALIALGEPAPTTALEHLAECAFCANELAALGETVRLARSSEPLRLESPSNDVWGRISDELGLGSTRHPELDAVVDEIRPRRSRAARWWITGTAVAASVGLIVGLVGGLWFQAAPRDAGTVLAEAALQAFPDWPDAAGRADVEDSPNGGRELVLHVDAPRPQGSYREVWLIAADASRLVSLGVLEGDDGRFALPDDLDLAQYPLVDVSAETDDGDPNHSGDSIVRGELRSIGS